MTVLKRAVEDAGPYRGAAMGPFGVTGCVLLKKGLLSDGQKTLFHGSG